MLLSCSPRPEARSRFHFWAKYVSREARNATGAVVLADRTDEVEVLRRQLRISDRKLEAILAEAQAEHWAESPGCQPAPEPYHLGKVPAEFQTRFWRSPLASPGNRLAPKALARREKPAAKKFPVRFSSLIRLSNWGLGAHGHGEPQELHSGVSLGAGGPLPG